MAKVSTSAAEASGFGAVFGFGQNHDESRTAAAGCEGAGDCAGGGGICGSADANNSSAGNGIAWRH